MINPEKKPVKSKKSFKSSLESLQHSRPFIIKLFLSAVLPLLILTLSLQAISHYTGFLYRYIEFVFLIISMITFTVIFSVFGAFINLHIKTGLKHFKMPLIRLHTKRNIKKVIIISIIYALLFFYAWQMFFIFAIVGGLFAIFIPIISIHSLKISNVIPEYLNFLNGKAFNDNKTELIKPIAIAAGIYLGSYIFLSFFRPFLYSGFIFLFFSFATKLLFYSFISFIYIVVSAFYLSYADVHIDILSDPIYNKDTKWLKEERLEMEEGHNEVLRQTKKTNKEIDRFNKEMKKYRKKTKDRFDNKGERNRFENMDKTIKY